MISYKLFTYNIAYTVLLPANNQDKAVPLAFKLPEKEKLVDWYRMRDTDHQAIP